MGTALGRSYLNLSIQHSASSLLLDQKFDSLFVCSCESLLPMHDGKEPGLLELSDFLRASEPFFPVDEFDVLNFADA